MKIIDEKGRLFGLINLLDLAVLIGVVVAIFVGVSAWLALSAPPVEVVAFTPKSLTAGSAEKLNVKLENERYLVGARLFLNPVSFDGSSLSFIAKIPFSVRDSISFSIPKDVKAGTYSAYLETTTRDVFGRSTILTSLLAKNFKVNEPKVKKQRATNYDGQCLWNIGFEAIIISSDEVNPALSAGDSLADISGIQYLVTDATQPVPEDRRESLPNDFRDKAAVLARLEVTAGFDSLWTLLNRSGPLLTLYGGGNELFVAVSGDASVMLDILFYLNEPDQLELLADQTELHADGDQVSAVVIKSFGELDNPWVDRGAVAPEKDMGQAFDIARIRLNCRFGRDGIYFGRTRLEPDRLIGFQAGGTKIIGGILSQSPLKLNAVVRVMVEAVPSWMTRLLKPGVEVTDNRGREVAGSLLRVVDIDRLETPEIIALNGQSGFGQNYNRLLVDLKLDCALSHGVPTFFGQQIDFGRDLNFALLGQALTGTVKYDAKLPPRGTLARETIQVEFKNVPPELVAWIRVGEQEYSEDGPATWKIERIISNQPAKIIYPSSDGSKALLVDHPENRSIRCLVEIQVQKAGNDLYYNGNLLKVGTGITFNARRWSQSATVLAF